MMRAFTAVQPALGVAAHGVVQAQRMALGVHADRLFATERQLHRRAGDVRQQRGLRLHRHVFLAAEGAAVGQQLDEDLVFAAGPGNAPPGAGRRRCPGPGSAGASTPSARGSASALSGSRNRCSMRCVGPGAADHVRAGGQRGRRVAAADDGLLEQVGMLRVDAWRVRAPARPAGPARAAAARRSRPPAWRPRAPCGGRRRPRRPARRRRSAPPRLRRRSWASR